MIDTATIMNFGSLLTSPKPEVIFSENRNTVLVSNFKGQQFEAITFEIDSMRSIWERPLEIYNEDYFRHFEDILVSDLGQMFLILDIDNKKFKSKNHHYLIFEYGVQAIPIVRYSVFMQGHMTYDAKFLFDNKNKNLICTGMYSKKSRAKANGIFYLSVEAANPENYVLHFEPFSEQILTEYLNEKQKKHKGIGETEIRDMILRRDGGALMIAENTRYYERPLISGGTIRSDGRRFLVDYNLDDLLVISMHPNGQIYWNSVLRKKQYSQDDDAVYSSFYTMRSPEALRILFNDEIKSENTVSEYVLYADGSSERHSVLSTDNQNIRLLFTDAVQTGPNELIVPSINKKRLKLVRIEFDKET